MLEFFNFFPLQLKSYVNVTGESNKQIIPAPRIVFSFFRINCYANQGYVENLLTEKFI